MITNSELAQPLLLFKKLTGNIIGNQLNYRKSKAKTELSTSQRNKDNENFKTYVVIVFSDKAKMQQCMDVEKIIQEQQILTQFETISKTERYLYLSADIDTLLSLADEAELMKETINGSLQKFNQHSITDYLLPGMTSADIVRYCEAPVLIKDAIKPILMPYIKTGLIADMFPLHDYEYLKKFSLDWNLSTLPIENIRSYFGSSIGLYFGFIQFYTKALIFPTIFGLFQYLWSFDLSVVCCFYVIWSTIFLELWKRKCAGYSYHWGTIEMSSLDKPRNAYKGDLKPDPITGKLTPQYPIKYTYLQMYCISYPVVLLCVIAVAFFALYQFQIEAEVLADFGADSWLLYVPCIVQSLLISVFSWAYEKLATFLTDLENHRTRSQFDRHRVNKLIIFEIVNNFFSLFYIAFVLKDLHQLNYQLMTQLIIFQLVCIAQEIGFPLLAVLRQKVFRYIHHEVIIEKLENVSDTARYQQCMYESNLDPYQSTYEDYMQICIQFGYVVMFAAVAPFAAFGALINNVFAMHVDLIKLCTIYQRPFARRTKNIGAWQSAFEFLSVMCILSNCGVLYLQPNVQNFVDNLFPNMFHLSFVLFEHLLLGLKFLIHKAIHEKPRWVRIALLKADYESSQAYKNIKKLKSAYKIQ